MNAPQLAWLILCWLIPVSMLCTQERPPENPTSALLVDAAAKLEAKKWLDAIEQYQKILDTAANEIVSVDGRHYSQARWVVHAKLAELPPDALKLYRDRLEPQAVKRVQEAKNAPTDQALRAVLADMFCCAACEDAIHELARRAFQRGNFDEAAHYWQMLLPDQPQQAIRYPQPKTDPSAVHARLILLHLYRHERTEASEAFAEFKKRFPNAKGLLAGKNDLYITTLQELFSQPRLTSLQPSREEPDWSTFAGDPSRRGTLRSRLPYFWPDEHTWKIDLPFTKTREVPDTPPVNPLHPRSLAFHPAIVDGRVLLGDGASVHAFDALTGKRLAHETFLKGSPTTVPVRQPVRHTLTVANGVIYTRVGSAELRSGDRVTPSTIVALTGATVAQPEFDILWRLDLPRTNDSTTHVEGVPVVLDGRMYVSFWRQSPTETYAGVACYRLGAEKDVPELLWERIVGKAATEPNAEARVRHDLLTLQGDYVLTCTHGGAVVALDRRTGTVQWEYRYPRIEQPITPRYRDVCPVCVDGTRVYAAPADSDRLLCLDLLSGQLLWERDGIEVVHLLGIARGRLVATIGGMVKGIRGFNTRTGADTGEGGWTIHDDGGEYTFGRGLVADEAVIWPTKHGLYFLNPLDGTPLRQPIRGSFGNLCYADGYLIVTTSTEMFGYVAERKQIGLRQKALQADPDNQQLQTRWAKANIDAGQFVDAEQALNFVGEQAPPLRWHLAERQWRAGDRAGAFRNYQLLAKGPSSYAAAGAIRLAQFNDDPKQHRQAWQEAWNKTGTVLDERGIPVSAKMFTERFAPERSPKTVASPNIVDAPIVTALDGSWEVINERPIGDPTLRVLHACAQGILTAGRAIHHWPQGTEYAFQGKPTQGIITANGAVVIANDEYLAWLSTKQPATETDLSQGIALHGNSPALVSFDQAAFPLASGREPRMRITRLQSMPTGESVSFVVNDTTLVERYGATVAYSSHDSGSPARCYLDHQVGRFHQVARLANQWELKPLPDGPRKTWPVEAKPQPEPPAELDRERLLFTDGNRITLLNVTTMKAQHYVLPQPSRLSGIGTRFRFDRDDRSTAMLLIDRNDGVELDRLDTATMKRDWPHEPVFLGRQVFSVVVDRGMVFVLADGELRAYGVNDGVVRWRVPIPESQATWQLWVSPHQVLMYPTEALLKSSSFDPVGAIQRAGWNKERLLHVVTKSYDVWVDREFPVFVLDRDDGQLSQRLLFPALGPSAALNWGQDRLVVVTGTACWTLQTPSK